MTGMEWAVCHDPRLMVTALSRQCAVSDRRWRLFVAAFWRWIADRLPESQQEVIDVATATEDWAETGRLPTGERASTWPDMIFFGADARQTAMRTAEFPYHGSSRQVEQIAQQTALLRDIFGNPFRIPHLESRRRTSDVVALARAIYDEKVFERMPILADALMDAGCEDEAIVGHCRGENSHVRGCWVLDLVLGKE